MGVLNMEEIGIDEWFWKMREHKRKGHHIIKYPERDIKEIISDIEKKIEEKKS